jgi:hypothetical protein
MPREAEAVPANHVVQYCSRGQGSIKFWKLKLFELGMRSALAEISTAVASHIGECRWQILSSALGSVVVARMKQVGRQIRAPGLGDSLQRKLGIAASIAEIFASVKMKCS